jgi:hypothetical protein
MKGRVIILVHCTPPEWDRTDGDYFYILRRKFSAGDNNWKKCWVELSFLSTALLLNMIYPPMKFQVDTSNTFWDMLRTKMWDRWTDGHTHKMILMWLFFVRSFWPFLVTQGLKKTHTSKNRMNRIKENLLLPIVLQVTQIPLGSYGQTDGWTEGLKDRQTETISISPAAFWWGIITGKHKRSHI